MVDLCQLKFIYLCWFLHFPACLFQITSLVMQLIYWMALSGGSRDWSLAFFIIPVHSILPLLPLFFSLHWDLINMCRTAYVVEPVHNLGKDTSTQRSLWEHFSLLFRLCFGKVPEFLPRSSHLLHNLGCVTVSSNNGSL